MASLQQSLRRRQWTYSYSTLLPQANQCIAVKRPLIEDLRPSPVAIAASSADIFLPIQEEEPHHRLKKRFKIDGRAVYSGDQLGHDLVFLEEIPSIAVNDDLRRFHSQSITPLVGIYQVDKKAWIMTEYIPCTLSKLAIAQSSLFSKEDLQLIAYSVRCAISCKSYTEQYSPVASWMCRYV